MKTNKEFSRSEALASKVVYAAMNALRRNNGELPSRRVVEEVAKVVEFNDWEAERYEKTGNLRWQAILQFYSIDCIKAGFILKNKGV